MKKASAKELDTMFESGQDMSDYIDYNSASHINKNLEPVETLNVEFPVWMIEELDKQAGLLAINRQAVIKTWISDRIKTERAKC